MVGAVRLRVPDQCVVDATQMNDPGAQVDAERGQPIPQPAPVTVPGRGVRPERLPAFAADAGAFTALGGQDIAIACGRLRRGCPAGQRVTL